MRVSLTGGDPDQVIIGFLDTIEPESSGEDVDLLLIIWHLVRQGWIDAHAAAPVLQRSVRESGAALQTVEQATRGGHPIINRVRGVPVDQTPAYRLSDRSREVLDHLIGPTRSPEGREGLILDWARSRGRVSSTEVADLTGHTVVYSGRLLLSLAEEGHLVGSRPTRIGRGFHYLPADPEAR